MQPGFSFAGAITTNSLQPEIGAALIRFLRNPNVEKVISDAGLIPIQQK